jgi:hypothetical protein
MADTKVSALTAASALDGTEVFPVVQAGVSKQATINQVKASIPDPHEYWINTTVDTNSTVTPAAAANLLNESGNQVLGIGTYLIEGVLLWKTAATTTGIEVYFNHTGTAPRLVATFQTGTTGTTASSGVADQSTTSTAQLVEYKAQRANNTASGVMQGTDTADSVCLTQVAGSINVSASGNLQLMFRSEVAGSLVTMMTGCILRLTKVA